MDCPGKGACAALGLEQEDLVAGLLPVFPGCSLFLDLCQAIALRRAAHPRSKAAGGGEDRCGGDATFSKATDAFNKSGC